MANVTKVSVSFDDGSTHEFMGMEDAIVGVAALEHEAALPVDEPAHDAPEQVAESVPSESEAPAEDPQPESAEGGSGASGEAVAANPSEDVPGA